MSWHCKECDYKFVKFINKDFKKAIFKCPKCNHSTKGYTDVFGHFLGKVKKGETSK